MRWLVHMVIFCLLLFPELIQAQPKLSFLKPDTTLNKKRVALVSGSIVGLYGAALGVLNVYWYKGYPRSKFHFFNDGKEWLGVDKAGHIYNAYYQSRWAVGLFRWTGMKDRNAIWIGGFTGTFLQSSIEILDGYSAKWGFSGYDFLANMVGSGIVIGQELAWKEQRISIKISATPINYPDDLHNRAKALYGNTVAELFLKDYNAITTWASLNIKSFIRRESRFPGWLNVAVGYGANGMYGGFANQWCKTPDHTEYKDCAPDQQVDRSDIRRYSQLYLSFDVDFTKIQTKRRGLKLLLQLLNMVKVPSPTIEFNPVDKVKFHPIWF